MTTLLARGVGCSCIDSKAFGVVKASPKKRGGKGLSRASDDQHRRRQSYYVDSNPDSLLRPRPLYPRTPTLSPAHILPGSSVLSTSDELDEEVPDGQEDVGDGGYDRRDDLRGARINAQVSAMHTKYSDGRRTHVDDGHEDGVDASGDAADDVTHCD
jgi:hypothetical protein